MTTFDTEFLFEFSKAIRHSLIAIESLNELKGVDQPKVTALADCVRHAHAVTKYMVTLIGTTTVETN